MKLFTVEEFMKVRKIVCDKKENGYMTIEATIALTTFLFFMMFVMNVGHIYQVQNYMTHSALQTGKCLAFSSFSYDQVSFVDKLEDLGFMVMGNPDKCSIEYSWNWGGYSNAAKEMFNYCAGGSPAKTQEALDKFGVTSMNFDGTTVENDDLVLKMTYDIELPYKFFGYDKITMHQRVVCGLWK